MPWKGFIATALLMLTLCTAGAASALPFDPDAAEAAGEKGVLGGLWDRFVRWIDQVARGEGEGGVTVLEMEGCHLDPNGICGGGT